MGRTRTVSLREALDRIDRDCSAGRFAEAAALAREITRRVPDVPAGWLAVAQSALTRDLGRVRSASRRALALAPGLAEAYVLLSQAQREPAPADARRQARRALTAAPGSLPANTVAALVELRTAAADRPVPVFRRPALLAPRSERSWTILGDALLSRGERAGAADSYLRALRVDPASAPGLYGLSMAGAGDRAPELLASAEARLTRGDLTGEAREFAAFALAGHHDRLRETDRAFHWYAVANAAHRAANPPDMALLRRFLARCLAAEWPTPVPRPTVATRHPIFIVGLPGSGTTMAESILAMHSAVTPGGELGLIGATAHRIAGYPDRFSTLSDADAHDLAARYLQDVDQAVAPATALFTDKMPTNFLYVGLIRRLFPKAPILHLRRDPMALAWSLYRRRFTDGHDYAYDLDDIAGFIAVHDRLMRHWTDLWPNSIHSVRFEDLVENTERTARAMVAALGLPWEPHCLEFHRARRHITTASALAVRRPADPGVQHQWRPYARHLQAVRARLAKLGAEI